MRREPTYYGNLNQTSNKNWFNCNIFLFLYNLLNVIRLAKISHTAGERNNNNNNIVKKANFYTCLA